MISILILHVHIVATMNGGQLAPPTTRYAICYTCVSIALATACNTDTFTTLTTLVVTLRFTWRLRFRKCSCTIWKQLFTITRRRLVVWLFAYDQVAINRFAALCCIHTFIWHSYNEKSFFYAKGYVHTSSRSRSSTAHLISRAKWRDTVDDNVNLFGACSLNLMST